MEIELIIPVILLIAIFAYIIFMFCRAIWSQFDHSAVPESRELQPDAKIVRVYSEKVQYTKNGMKYKTTVIFSDGFKFVTHETDRVDGFLSYQISIGPELYKRIIDSANEAHERSLRNQQKLPPDFESKFERQLRRQIKRQLRNNKH